MTDESSTDAADVEAHRLTGWKQDANGAIDGDPYSLPEDATEGHGFGTVRQTSNDAGGVA
jgi:hypothetical protein